MCMVEACESYKFTFALNVMNLVLLIKEKIVYITKINGRDTLQARQRLQSDK